MSAPIRPAEPSAAAGAGHGGLTGGGKVFLCPVIRFPSGRPTKHRTPEMHRIRIERRCGVTVGANEVLSAAAHLKSVAGEWSAESGPAASTLSRLAAEVRGVRRGATDRPRQRARLSS